MNSAHPANPLATTAASRTADLAILVLSIVLGVGSVAMFATMQSVRYADFGWPDSLALPWDALLSLAFFAQHSGMARRPVRARVAAALGARYEPAVYSIASGIALALVAFLWQRSPTRLLVLEGVPRWIALSLSLLAVAAFVLAARSLRRWFDPLGLRPIRAHLRSQPAGPTAGFVVRGPYLWVRHPLYSCVLVLLWANPEVTADQLLLNVMWSAWIWAGARLEERDLVAEFGKAYRAYQRQVPMLIPWKGRVASAGVDGRSVPAPPAGIAQV